MYVRLSSSFQRPIIWRGLTSWAGSGLRGMRHTTTSQNMRQWWESENCTAFFWGCVLGWRHVGTKGLVRQDSQSDGLERELAPLLLVWSRMAWRHRYRGGRRLRRPCPSSLLQPRSTFPWNTNHFRRYFVPAAIITLGTRASSPKRGAASASPPQPPNPPPPQLQENILQTQRGGGE